LFYNIGPRTEIRVKSVFTDYPSENIIELQTKAEKLPAILTNIILGYFTGKLFVCTVFG
jgi:hypothetical protein